MKNNLFIYFFNLLFFKLPPFLFFFFSLQSYLLGALLMPSLSGGQQSVGSLVHSGAVGQRLSVTPVTSSKLSSADSGSLTVPDSKSPRLK